MRSDYLQYYISHYNKEPELNFPDEITIYDTTLRDGEQTPGVCFSPEEKLEIAKKLDEIKIKQIEAGFPIVSKKEQESVPSAAVLRRFRHDAHNILSDDADEPADTADPS